MNCPPEDAVLPGGAELEHVIVSWLECPALGYSVDTTLIPSLMAGHQASAVGSERLLITGAIEASPGVTEPAAFIYALPE